MKRTLLLLSLIAISTIYCLSQELILPQFPGGKFQLHEYLENYIVYPESAKEKGIEGSVTVMFTVAADGSIIQPTIGISLDPVCDSTALAIIRNMPKWTPATVDGKPQAMSISLNLKFKDKDRQEETYSDYDSYAVLPANRFISGKEFIDNESEDKPFTAVEQMPSFPGGQQELDNYINTNLNYPAAAQKNGIQGRVTIRFIVKKDGSTSDIQVLRGIDPACDKEAVRLIESMPTWNPGKQNGIAVPVYYTLPITFRLPKEDTEETGIAGMQDVQISIADVVSADDDIAESQIREYRVIQQETDDLAPFTTVEQMPTFPGGEKELNKYISANLKFPVTAQENGIQGRVTIRFVVEKDGSISDIKIVRGIDPSCDKEAVRMVQNMPKWNPGKQRGIPVPVYYTIPITFSLPKNNNDEK